MLFITNMMKRCPRITAVLFGIFITILLIVLTEGILGIFHVHKNLVKQIQYKPYRVKDKSGIIWAIPGAHRVKMARTRDKKIIYDVIYTVDCFGKRSTPVNNRKTRDKFIFFFGGSFTYGEGLQDDQTVAFNVGKMTQQYVPYNFGFHGDGPFDALAKTRNIDFRKQVEQENGIMVYTFIDHHIQRVMGMCWGEFRLFYVKAKDGELVRANFLRIRPLLIRLYRLLAKSRILKTFGIREIAFVTNKDLELTALALRSSFDAFKKQYPKAKMYLLIFPGSRPGYKEKILEHLRDTSINILDYSGLFDYWNDPKYYLAEEDKHPSVFVNEVIAQRIVRDLGLR